MESTVEVTTKDEIQNLIRLINSLLLELVEITCDHDFSLAELFSLNPALKEFAHQRRCLDAFDLAVASAVVSTGCARAIGSPRAEDYLVKEFRIPKSIARKYVAVAETVAHGETHHKAGLTALRAGHFSVDTLHKVFAECENLAPQASEAAESIIQSVCKQSGVLGNTGAVRETRRLVRKANARFPTDPDIAFKKRKLTIGKQDSDGGAKVTGYLDGATLALLDQCITSFIRRADDAADVDIEISEHNNGPGSDIQKVGVDALRDALKNKCTHDTANNERSACTVVAIVTAADLHTLTVSNRSLPDESLRPAMNQKAVTIQTRKLNADLTHPSRLRIPTTSGLDLSLTDLLRLGIGEEIYGAFFNPEIPLKEQSLRLGRGKRSASFAQRLALALLDGCCQYPGCEVPMSKCDVHHLNAWANGGTTDIENLTLMCRHHHSLNDDSHSDHRRGHMVARCEENAWKTGWMPPAHHNSESEPVQPSVQFNSSHRASHAPLAIQQAQSA